METLLERHELDTSAETEVRVLELIGRLSDPEDPLCRKFYSELGVPTDDEGNLREVPNLSPLTEARRPMHGHRLLLKDETSHVREFDGEVHEASSFKRRGALLAALLAKEENPELETLVTMSHGNHGIAVAMAAKALGMKAEVHLPKGTNEVKVQKLRDLGAHVVQEDDYATFEDSSDGAILSADSQGTKAKLISPFDQDEVMAGQASLVLESVWQLQSMDKAGLIDLQNQPIEFVFAVAGGGLITGASILVKYFKDLGVFGDNVRVVGAQMEDCDAARRSVEDVQAGGEGVADFSRGFNAMCDSTAVMEVGKRTLPYLSKPEYVQVIRLAREDEVGEAMEQLTGIYNKMVEPAGALAYAVAHNHAAELDAPVKRSDQTLFIATVCGSNVTRETYDYFKNRAAEAYEAKTRWWSRVSRAEAIEVVWESVGDIVLTTPITNSTWSSPTAAVSRW